MNIRKCFKALGVAVGGAITFWCNCVIAQITPDATLPNNSRITTQGNLLKIEGGTQAGSNIFHSFEQFSVPNGSTAHFNNALDIQNIISRVTGKSISHIYGTLEANGTANLFLINPSGIIFGPNATLNIGGSFIASTASSLNFADGIKFSATDPQTTPLLTVSVPIGLQFGATAAPIRNQSQASPNGATNTLIFPRRAPVGLQVQPGKTLALVGGDVTMEGGNLTAKGGRIELGSVAGHSLVSLNPTNQVWALSYEGVQNFQNIQLIERTVDGSEKISSYVDASDVGGGNIQVQGRHVLLTGGSGIFAKTFGSQPGGNLTVNASESVELTGFRTFLATQTTGVGHGGDITITTGKLIVRDAAQVFTSTIENSGTGGQLTVNASEFVELTGRAFVANSRVFAFSGLFSATAGAGNAGDITITTARLRIQNGAQVSAESSGTINLLNEFIPAQGKGGNLTVNASESIELIGTSPTDDYTRLSALTNGSGNAGNLTLTTRQLIVQDNAAITVSSGVLQEFTYLGDRLNLGKAGELNVTARSIRLDNKGKLTSETDTGQGGNINLQVRDFLLLRGNSQISTNAGKEKAGGDGGNITIYAPNGFIVAVPEENSDITANAYTGSGGRVQINAAGLLGIVPRRREDLVRQLGVDDPTTLNPQNLPTSDITAISQTNPTLNGVVNINRPDVDINSGLINLQREPNEPKLAQSCDAILQNQSEFIITGRGGIPPNPREFLKSNFVQVDWVSLENANYPSSRNTEIQRRRSQKKSQNITSVNPSTSQIVEAQGWVVDSNGDVILVAQAPMTSHSPWFNSASCKG